MSVTRLGQYATDDLDGQPAPFHLDDRVWERR